MCGDTEGVIGVFYCRVCYNVSQIVDHPTTQTAAKAQCRDYSKNIMGKIPNVNEHKCSLFCQEKFLLTKLFRLSKMIIKNLFIHVNYSHQ